MKIQISFEEFENVLRNRPALLAVLVFLTASFSVRYVVFEVGLYFWASYLFLEFLLILGSARLGGLFKSGRQTQPLSLIVNAIALPLLAAGFDQLYLSTILRYTDAVSISIANLSAAAQWIVSPEGMPHLSTYLSVRSDLLWFLMIGEMAIVFLFSRLYGKQPPQDTFATA